MPITHELKLNGKPIADEDGVVRSIPWVLMSTDGARTEIGGSGVVTFHDAKQNDPGFVALDKDDKNSWVAPTSTIMESLKAAIKPDVLKAAEEWGASALEPPVLTEVKLV